MPLGTWGFSPSRPPHPALQVGPQAGPRVSPPERPFSQVAQRRGLALGPTGPVASETPVGCQRPGPCSQEGLWRPCQGASGNKGDIVRPVVVAAALVQMDPSLGTTRQPPGLLLSGPGVCGGSEWRLRQPPGSQARLPGSPGRPRAAGTGGRPQGALPHARPGPPPQPAVRRGGPALLRSCAHLRRGHQCLGQELPEQEQGQGRGSGHGCAGSERLWRQRPGWGSGLSGRGGRWAGRQLPPLQPRTSPPFSGAHLAGRGLPLPRSLPSQAGENSSSGIFLAGL